MDNLSLSEIKKFLDEKYEIYNRPEFVENDPISIPHSFNSKEDIEISAFITSCIAWGQRKSIVKNAYYFMKLMDNSPYDFVINHSDEDLRVLDKAVHRTFNGEDLKYFVNSLKNIYLNYGGLENLFCGYDDLKDALINFYKIFFDKEVKLRTRRHVSNVESGSAAKRLNMFLRWMVRNDGRGVDLGIWKNIPPAKLYIPLDVHSGRISRMLGILKRTQNDWKAVEELTNILRFFDPEDPVKYDFSLFGLGVNEKF
jgi:uncharacterized protein (TIGR02757 family)